MKFTNVTLVTDDKCHKCLNCHIFRSDEGKKKNIKFITRYMSLELERDPQVPDFRVRCYGEVVDARPPALFGLCCLDLYFYCSQTTGNMILFSIR